MNPVSHIYNFFLARYCWMYLRDCQMIPCMIGTQLKASHSQQELISATCYSGEICYNESQKELPNIRYVVWAKEALLGYMSLYCYIFTYYLQQWTHTQILKNVYQVLYFKYFMVIHLDSFLIRLHWIIKLWV